MSKRIPYEVQVLSQWPHWRDDFAWPLDYLELRQPGIDIALASLEFVATLDDRLMRDSFLLLVHRIVPLAIWKMEAAHTAAAAARQGVKLEAQTPELAFLFCDEEGPAPPRLASGLTANHLPASPLRLFLQQLKWTHKWSGPWRALTSLYRSDFQVISSSPLMSREIAARGVRPALRPAQVTLNKARRQRNFQVPDRWWEAADALVRRLVELAALEPPFAARLRCSLAQDIHALLDICGRDMAGLRHLRGLPQAAWSGTGSKHAARAVGLEVMRRGGEAVRFTHGGTHGLIRSFGQVASLELAVSTTLVASSEGQAALIRSSGEVEMVAPYNADVVVAGGRGEPAIFEFARRLPARRRSRRIKVVLVLSPLVEFVAKPASKILNNVLYLDFNYHVLEELRRLPVDVVCKPHPEGLFAGRHHPLSNPVVPGDTPFDQVVRDADVVVVDQPFSTALWQMMSTERGIVYIDTGIAEFHPDVEPEVRRRCCFVDARVDGRGRFRIDSSELAAAVEAVAGEDVQAEAFQTFHG